MTVAQCAEIAGTRVKRLPTVALCRALVKLMWNMGVTSIPADAFPYLIGSYTMETSKLRNLLGRDYEDVVRYTSEAALADSKIQSEPVRITEIENAS